MKRIIATLLGLMAWATHAQQTSYSFTMEEAVTFALDSSYSSIKSRMDMASALKKKWETTADGLPQISASADYTNQLKQPVTPLPGEIVGGEPGTFVPVIFAVPQQMNLTATLNQLIFDGSYLVALQASQAFLEYSENLNEKTRLEVRKGVINAYGSVLLADENVEILERNRNRLLENVKETQMVYENGLAEEEDVEQLQITLSQIENSLANAKRMSGIARQMLNLALGLPVETEVTLEDRLELLAEEQVDFNLMETPVNLEDNVDIRIAENLNKQRTLEYKLERSRALPVVSGFLNYGTTAFNNDFVFFDSETPWFQSSILGVSVNIPIFSSLRRSARTQQARIAVMQAEVNFRETLQRVSLETAQAKSDYNFSIENLRNAQRNLQLAERIENKNEIKFDEGIASSFELRQAQTQLYTAQSEYINAMLQVINSRAALETVLNTPMLREDIKNSRK